MRRWWTVVLIAVIFGQPTLAHRLDEYLQAILVSINTTQIYVSMRLIPGVAVSSKVISSADLDGDGKFSEPEQRAYAQKVLRDLSITENGHALTPRLQAVSFPSALEMNEGLGEIRIEFTVESPSESQRRQLVIKNHYEPGISVYLMNCLAPQDHDIGLIGQQRNQSQSYYQLDYFRRSNMSDSTLVTWGERLASTLSPFKGFPSMFRLGMRHIAEGTDHMLFLLALLLPAPLLATRSRWSASGTVRHSIAGILRVVSAFTIGHSITLALGALNVVSIPSRPIEVLIAVSILISALHALRPLFPGREVWIAGGFGLIHGMAFSATLQNLGVGGWQHFASVLGFNIGIETMQIIVVGATLPSLILLSRTPAYALFRAVGATFAALASLGWIVERSFGIHCSVDAITDSITKHAASFAIVLAVSSLLAWLNGRSSTSRALEGTELAPHF